MRLPDREERSALGMPLRRDLRLRTRVCLPALVTAPVAWLLRRPVRPQRRQLTRREYGKTVIMATHRIGRIVIGCLTGGIIVALALVVGPLAGAQEHVITGTVLLAFASSWALLAMLFDLLNGAAPAMGGHARWLHGVGRRWSCRLRTDRRGHRRAWVGLAAGLLLRFSVERLFASTGICTVARGSGSCTRCWAYTRCALLEGAIKPFENRSTAACMRRPASWSTSADTGFTCIVSDQVLPPSSSNQALARLPRIGDGSRPRSHTTPKYVSTTARVEAGAIRRLPRRTASPWPRTSTSCSIAGTFLVPLCSSGIRRAPSTSGSSPAGIPNKSREWCCSTANRPKPSSAFRISQLSTMVSAESLRCSRRWLDSA